MGQIEQRVLVEPEQRASEHDRERKVVFGHQQHVGKGHEVLHRHLLQQPHAVRACDGNARPFQRADHRCGERRAPPHQDEDVAGADRASLRLQNLSVTQPMMDLLGDALAQRFECIGAALVFVPGFERSARFRLLRLFDLPQLDEPCLSLTRGMVLDDRAVLKRETARRIVLREDEVHRFEYGNGRAERHVEGHFVPLHLRAARDAAKPASRLAEADGVGTLETVDRLLFVAHGEQRAWLFPRAGTGEKLRRQRVDDRPLLGVRVLGFVDQDVIDTAVDLVEHPRGRAALR
ncbi:MAG: hypothetical protein A49_02000 [Methyloceanibacter sp.]|nr:MAG: hypothetical protein A49_02000 [Methyloceanibacter sp.]